MRDPVPRTVLKRYCAADHAAHLYIRNRYGAAGSL
jgi:hypothetical protein